MVRVLRELRNIALEARVHKTVAFERSRRGRRRRRMENNCRGGGKKHFRLFKLSFRSDILQRPL